MFANDLYENWDSTENQDNFIKSYFGNGKVLSKKFKKLKQQSIDSKPKNMQSNQDFCNIQQNKNNKHSLTSLSKSNKKFKKSAYSLDKEIKQDFKDNKVEEKVINISNIPDSVHLRPKKKNRKRNKSKIKDNFTKQMDKTSVDIDSNVMNINDSNCLGYYNSNDRTDGAGNFFDNPRKDISLENEKIVKNSTKLESTQTQSKKKKRRVKNKKHNGVNMEEGGVSETKSSISAERQRMFMENSSQIKSKKMANCFNELENCQLKSEQRIKNKNKHDLEYMDDIEKADDGIDETRSNTNAISKGTSSNNKNAFQSKIHQKLKAAKFRYLNEMLYTNAGKDAWNYFQENTDEFMDYHDGYKSQVLKWPINPVDFIIKEISQMNKQAVIADLGCGEAKIAEAFPKRIVHSFDLIAFKDCVTACDMASVPLPNNSVDIAVFCLSLMGTNWKDYVKEGHRILKLGGILKVAEIESRIENLDKFIKNIEKLGFSLVNKNTSHKMFVFLNFKKVNKSKKSSNIPDIVLKPCLYKKR